jgi:hypothetical protein
LWNGPIGHEDGCHDDRPADNREDGWQHGQSFLLARGSCGSFQWEVIFVSLGSHSTLRARLEEQPFGKP